MKVKFFFTTLLLTASSVTFAQFKIDSSGNAILGTSTAPQTSAKFTIGTEFATYSQARMGLNVNTMTTEQSTQNVGVNSVVDGTGPTNGVSIGVRGMATGGYQDMNFGVLGSITGPYTYGAGVFGAINNYDGISVNGRYAGYFVGPVKATEFITIRGVFMPSDERQNENILSISRGDAHPSSTLNNLLSMNVVEYNHKAQNTERGNTETSMGSAAGDETDNTRHFGLLAQELGEIYPNLVVEGQDKTLSVNYLELIPILIRGIQELKQELDEVKGTVSANSRYSDATSVNVGSMTGNVLYQNTPNPFKEQTTIRFKLADGVRDVSVCIFDMTGKMLKKLPVSSEMESISIGGNELGEGMFLYSLMINGQVMDTKRMVISK